MLVYEKAALRRGEDTGKKKKVIGKRYKLVAWVLRGRRKGEACESPGVRQVGDKEKKKELSWNISIPKFQIWEGKHLKVKRLKPGSEPQGGL